jgi:hypothetical protein
MNCMLEKRLRNDPLQFLVILFFRGKQKSGRKRKPLPEGGRSRYLPIAMLPLVGLETKMPPKSPGSSRRLMPTRILAPAGSLQFADPGLSEMSHLGKSI